MFAAWLPRSGGLPHPELRRPALALRFGRDGIPDRKEHPDMTKNASKAAIFRGVGNVDVVDLPYSECGSD
jgi:hypothetical protein